MGWTTLLPGLLAVSLLLSCKTVGEVIDSGPHDDETAPDDLAVQDDLAIEGDLAMLIDSALEGHIDAAGATPDLTYVFQGGTQFASLAEYDSTPVGVNQFAIADYDDDGNLDIAVAGFYDMSDPDPVLVYMGRGDGTFRVPQAFGNVIDGGGVASGDFNRDGVPDLVQVGLKAIQFLLATPGKTSVFETQQLQSRIWCSALLAEMAGAYAVVADVDLDGSLDVAFRADNSSTHGNPTALIVYDGDDYQRLMDCTWYEDSLDFGRLIVGDFDEDGYPDLVTNGPGSTRSPHVNVYLGPGKNQHEIRSTATATSSGFITGPNQMDTADVDEDGHLDIVTAGHYSPMSLLLGRGDGTFVMSAPFLAPMKDTLGATIADFDGDGHLDVAASTALPGPVHPTGSVMVFYGDGHGHFSSPSEFLVPWPVVEMRAGDFNRDGRPDLVIAISGRLGFYVLISTSP